MVNLNRLLGIEQWFYVSRPVFDSKAGSIGRTIQFVGLEYAPRSDRRVPRVSAEAHPTRLAVWNFPLSK